MKHSFVNSKLTAFAAAVLLCCSITLSSSITKAQPSCPDISWTGPASYITTIPGTTCKIKIWYCTKWVGGVFELQIEEIDQLTTGCSSLDMPTIVGDAAQLVYGDPNLSSNFLPCPTGTTIETIRKVCWTYNSGGPFGNPWFVPCPEASQLCILTCSVCTNDQGTIETDCVSSESGPSDGCNDWTSPPVNGTCYSLPCPNN